MRGLVGHVMFLLFVLVLIRNISLVRLVIQVVMFNHQVIIYHLLQKINKMFGITGTLVRFILIIGLPLIKIIQVI